MAWLRHFKEYGYSTRRRLMTQGEKKKEENKDPETKQHYEKPSIIRYAKIKRAATTTTLSASAML